MSFANTIAAALRTADTLAGVTIKYRRGGAETEIEYVRRGNTFIETVGSDNVAIRGRTQDFLIEAARLLIDGVATKPQIGDAIVETIGASQFIYEVRPVAGQPPWTYHDPHCQWFRIHTQHIATE